ncbi:MAG: C4-type zinc ribbon domain-containing protein [Clostridiales bacterium]|nr:C4-type zinc ribbon domain-containing protein [Clostridiales bacterium]
MDQLMMLWEYQTEDMKADKLANDIRRSPLRQKMENDRNLFMERQKQYKQIEEQVAVLTDRKDAIRDALSRAKDQLSGLQSRFEQNPPQELEAVRSLMAEVNKCRETIVSYEQEMKRLTQEANTNDQRGNTIRTEAARLRSEFERLKAQYDKEMPDKKAQQEAQRAAADKKAEGIDPKLMEHYMRIKKHITPPLSRLINGQCSGCNTSLPSAVLHRVRNASDEIVECESCGRMIIRM